MHPVLLSTARALDAAGVRWCFLRLPERPDAPQGDIDLLLDARDLESARNAFAELGFVRLPAWGYGNDAFLLSYHPPTDGWIWLHVASDLDFGRYGTLSTDAAAGILERRVHGESGWLPSPDDAFWALLLHCLVDKRRIKERHRSTLQTLAGQAKANSALARTFATVAPDGWSARRIIEATAGGEWHSLEIMSRRIVPARPEDAGSLRRDIAARWLLRQLTRLRDGKRRGMCVALLGPDGAGKSTLAAGIKDSFFFPSTSVYMGVGTAGAIAAVARRLGRVRAGGRSLLGRPPFTYFGFVGTLWVRYLTGQVHRFQGRLVVFDRYTYDALLPMPGGVSRLKDRALQVQARICPPPDLVLVLDVPGEVMYRRKGEFSPEQLENMRQKLLSLGDRIDEFEVVDATRPADVVRADVTERIWRRYVKRWNGQ